MENFLSDIEPCFPIKISIEIMFGFHSHFDTIFAILNLIIMEVFKMIGHKTQQFSKFYLKDTKIKLQKDSNTKN